MEKKRYTVKTFRGYQHCDSYRDAVASGRLLIDGIKDDKWAEEFWWCAIIDNHKGLTQIMTKSGSYYYGRTKWIHLT